MESYHTPQQQKAIFKIDMGAQCDVIPKWKYQQLCQDPLQTSTANLVTLGGHKLYTSGKACIQCICQGHSYNVEFEVVYRPGCRGDYNGRPSANICIEVEIVDQSRERSAI